MNEIAVIDLPHVPTRAQIERLERELFKFEQIELPTTHHFASGLYARELFIPAGTVLTGKVHKTEHLNICSKGRITVWTEDGMKTVEAPFTMVSRPGTKRVGFAHEDTIWITVHANVNEERDIQKLEDELVERVALTHEGEVCRLP